MTVASAITLCRSLWPAVTEAAASDAFLTAWYADASARAGEAWFDTDQLTAVAHLLAHHAYRVDPAGLLGAGAGVGAVQSMTTGRRSVSWGSATGTGSLSPGDAVLATTKPGLAYLELRERHAEPMFIDPLSLR